MSHLTSATGNGQMDGLPRAHTQGHGDGARANPAFLTTAKNGAYNFFPPVKDEHPYPLGAAEFMGAEGHAGHLVGQITQITFTDRLGGVQMTPHLVRVGVGAEGVSHSSTG